MIRARLAAIVAILLLILGGGAGFGISWKVQDLRMKRLRTEMNTLREENAVCQKVNSESRRAMDLAKRNLKNLSVSLSARLRARDALVAHLRSLDALKGKTDAASINNAREVRHEKNTGSDPLLDRLNGLFPAADSKN